jgi:broad specificity phosphatase PhoE
MATRAEVIWLLRHGNREDFVDPDWVATATRPLDPGLSPQGTEQARAAGDRLRDAGIQRIFTSPYLRCAQTAHLVAERIEAPVHLEPGLGELNHPDWSDGLPSLLSAHDLTSLTGPFDASHQVIHDRRYPETIDEAFARAARTAREIAARYEGPLLLVGHAASIIGIVVTLTGEERDIPCPDASLFRIEHRSGRWRSIISGDTAHLAEVTSAGRFR